MKRFAAFLTLFSLLSCKAVCGIAADSRSDIVFISDFGLQDDAVSQCKAAVYNVFPQARITDMTHNIPPYNMAIASFLLADAAKIWPPGTVFLTVVDPGVGSSRKMLAVKTKTGHFFVGPDNGLLTYPVRRLGLAAAVSLENPHFFRQESVSAPDKKSRTLPQGMTGLPESVTSTFHGRDIFAPVAAHLALNPDVFAKLGRPVHALAELPMTTPEISSGAVSGHIIYTEAPFGNVWTDIDAAAVASAGLIHGSRLSLEINGKPLSVPYVSSFYQVPEGEPLAYVNSRGLFSLALNQADFSKRFVIQGGEQIKISLSPSDLVDVMSMSGDLLGYDIRYATSNNFTGKKVYPAARCYLRREAASALLGAASRAREISSRRFGICVHDCYRPLSVQKIFWSIMPDERYVANPAKGSRHNRGMAVDVYPCVDGRELPAPTPYDDFSDKAYRGYEGAGKEATENSLLLEKLMQDAGFQGLSTEWWHYDYRGWENAPVMDLTFAE